MERRDAAFEFVFLLGELFDVALGHDELLAGGLQRRFQFRVLLHQLRRRAVWLELKKNRKLENLDIKVIILNGTKNRYQKQYSSSCLLKNFVFKRNKLEQELYQLYLRIELLLQQLIFLLQKLKPGLQYIYINFFKNKKSFLYTDNMK